MAKRIYCFSSLSSNHITSEIIKYNSLQNGFEADMMLFSTAQNRNHSYFQVSDLLKWSNKLESILTNLNHDLSLSGDKYLGNQNKWTRLWSSFNNGDFEIWGTFKTEDPLVISVKDQITAPSIELLVDEQDIIKNENGEYFINFDWVGVALLLGVPAGSGSARVSEIRDYHINQTSNPENMSPEEINQLLETQKQHFATLLEEKFVAFKTELQESMAFSNSKTLEEKQQGDNSPDDNTEPQNHNKEEEEEFETLVQLEHQIDKIKQTRSLNFAKRMANLLSEEQIDNSYQEWGVSNAAKAQELPSFFKKLVQK